MEPLIRHKGIVARLKRVNVDTDQIIPKQFLKRIERSGFGQFLFYDWRFTSSGALNPEFELNHPSVQGASILIADDNFGCGSSREHAVWALHDYGFRVVIAPSFADIFFNNCFKNGVLPIVLPASDIQKLDSYQTGEAFTMTVDLERQVIEISDGMRLTFEIDPHRKQMLLEGLDDIGITLRYNRSIETYEQAKLASYQKLYGTSAV